MTVVFVAAGAVDVGVRRLGGHVADALMAECRRLAKEQAMAAGGSDTILAGRIDVRNLASQRMVARAGFEPVDLPGSVYQDWVLVVHRIAPN